MGRPQLFKRWIALSTGQITTQLIAPLVSLILIQYTAIYLVPVVQTLDSAIQGINLYPVDSAIGFPNTYPLDSDLSDG